MEARIPWFLAISILFLMAIEIQSQNISLPGYTKWAVPSSPRDDMFCEETCASYPEYDRCCTCKSKQCWQINATACGVTVGHLSLEHINIFGSTILIDDPKNKADIHVLERTHGKMTELPSKICDYNDTLNYVDLSYNSLTNVDKLKCLTKLDTLLLNSNQIISIDNTTFGEMELLRVLSFANNKIEVLNPNTISTLFGNIHNVDFSGNKLYKTDITNIHREGPFCSLSFENSDLGNITNINNFKVDLDKSYGPGDTYMNNTNAGQMLDFSSVGITDYTSIGLFLKGQLHIDSGSIHCDCSIVPLFKGMGTNVLDFWPDLGDPNGLDLECQRPPSMEGVILKDVLRTGDYGNMTCGIVVNCTDGCVCTDKPSDDILIVDCRNRSLLEMPELMPTGRFNTRNVRLLLDHNYIQSLDDRDYLDRIKYLEMPDNPLGVIGDLAVKKLTSADYINIVDQRLNILPRSLLNIDPNIIQFGNHPVQCGCDDLWIGNWIRAYGAFDALYCQTKTGVIYAEDVTADTLECLEPVNNFLRDIAIILGVFCFLLLLIALSIKFKTEILLLKRRMFRTLIEGDPVVFLSMCEDNDDIFALIHYCVRPSLKHLNVRVKTPWYDIEYGEEKEAHLSQAVTASNVFVIFLCEIYLDRQQSVEEFDAIWKAFLLDSSKHIVIINWSGEDTSDFSDKRIRALFRTGYGIQFEAQDVRLMKRIALKVDPKLDVETIPEQFQKFPRDDKPAQAQVESEDHGPDKVEEALDLKVEPPTQKSDSVYKRLFVPKGEIRCNCKYRKCYVHMHNKGDTSFYSLTDKK